MLNVNRILVFLCIGVFSSSLYAVDVSKFDIKGIKLGMSKSEVLKKMPCKNYENNIIRLDNGKRYESNLYCKQDNGNNILIIEFNRKNITQKINKIIAFDTEPSFSKIKNKLIKKYGTPDAVAKQTSYSSTGSLRTLCWGSSCKVKKAKHYQGDEIDVYGSFSSANLFVKYNNYNAHKQVPTLNISLINYILVDNNYEWAEEQNKIISKQQKEKASNIDI